MISHDAYRIDEEKGATPDPLMGLFPFSFPLDETAWSPVPRPSCLDASSGEPTLAIDRHRDRPDLGPRQPHEVLPRGKGKPRPWSRVTLSGLRDIILVRRGERESCDMISPRQDESRGEPLGPPFHQRLTAQLPFDDR